MRARIFNRIEFVCQIKHDNRANLGEYNFARSRQVHAMQLNQPNKILARSEASVTSWASTQAHRFLFLGDEINRHGEEQNANRQFQHLSLRQWACTSQIDLACQHARH